MTQILRRIVEKNASRATEDEVFHNFRQEW
jgi:hypothetical protein